MELYGVDCCGFTSYIIYGLRLDEHNFPLLFNLCPTENQKFLKIGFKVWAETVKLEEKGYLDSVEFFGSDWNKVQFNAFCVLFSNKELVGWLFCDYHLSQNVSDKLPQPMRSFSTWDVEKYTFEINFFFGKLGKQWIPTN